MPKISVIIHTASGDDFMSAQGIPSYFRALVDNLARQNLKDFELIYVDTFHGENDLRFMDPIAFAPFRIKHVPVHPDHRYWYDKGYCYIAAAKNTGILYADGELCVTCDDAEFFPEHFLQQYWYHYKEQGRYLHALHKRMTSIQVENGLIRMPIAGDFYVNDHRWKMVENRDSQAHRHGTLCFAGTSFSIEDAMQLNGFNERMDGTKGLEDCDFGNRLKLLGRTFTVDRQGWLAIVDHPNYSDIVETGPDGQQTAMPLQRRRKIENLIAIENYGMSQCAVELPEIKANWQPIIDAHLQIIQRETLKYRHFDPLGPENAEKLALWLATPTFDLREQRSQLRRSSDWKW